MGTVALVITSALALALIAIVYAVVLRPGWIAILQAAQARESKEVSDE